MHVEKETVFFLAIDSCLNSICSLKPRWLSEETATKFNLAALAYNYCKLKPDKRNLFDVSEIRKIIKNLKNDEYIIISKLDKGNGCVILEKNLLFR